MAAEACGGAVDTANFNLGFPPAVRYTVTNVFGQNFQMSILNDSLHLDVSGTYTVQLYVGDGNGNATPVATMGGGVVTGVDLSGDAPVLLIGDRRIAVTDVREVRVQPPAGT